MHSHGKYIDLEYYREMSYHWECGLSQWAYRKLDEQFKGRLLSEKDVEAMQQILEMAKTQNRQVKVYDTSRLRGRLKALKLGVSKTPTVVMNGQRYEGLDEITHAV